MIVTVAQKKELRALLWENVKFKETYYEVYDHILTALEAYEDNDLEFDELIEQIINEDFGGMDMLLTMEAKREEIVVKQVRARHWQHIMSYFSLPLFIITLFVTGMAFYLGAYISRDSVIKMVAVTAILPIIPFLSKLFNLEYKASIKDGVVKEAGIRGVFILNLVLFPPLFFLDDTTYHFFNQAHVALTTVVAVLFTINCLSFIKLYRDEFKMKIA